MGQIRITGGSHRSRKIIVEDQPGLRPSTDRVRETLFNWLGQNLSGMSVLDLYTGSGILAFEAASRAASQVTCVDNNPKVISQLQQNLNLMGFDTINILQTNAKDFIQNHQGQFDLVFLDPPFDSNEMNTISDIISNVTATNGLLYREFGVSQNIAAMNHQHWLPLKAKKAGQVNFELWQKQ